MTALLLSGRQLKRGPISQVQSGTREQMNKAHLCLEPPSRELDHRRPVPILTDFSPRFQPKDKPNFRDL